VRSRVLIVGGTGATGRRIGADLLRWHPELELGVASRHPAPSRVPEGCHAIALDVSDSRAAVRIFAAYDLIILALGPFERHGGPIHRLCIEAGRDCLDINDSYEAAERIAELDELARDRGVTIATGMGLVPGLSGLLVRTALAQSQPSGRDLAVRLYMGARNSGGASSPYTLLAGFHREAAQLREGRLERHPVEWSGPACKTDFPGFGIAPTFQFSCPETLSLARAGALAGLGVRRLDHRYHIQFFPRALARMFTVLPILRTDLVLRTYSYLLYLMSGLLRVIPGTRSLVCLMVESSAAGRTTRCFVRSETLSSYDLTAAFASMIAGMLLTGALPRRSGVVAFDDFHHPSIPFAEQLARRGIVLEVES
jgi:Saccharopine dehydrogenase NADP binding domain